MEKKEKLINKYIWLVILILSLPAVRYLFINGFFGVSDDLHIAWLYEMDRVVKMWQFPPRFVPDLSYGFGYPLFTFVYPLPFYIGELFHLLGFSLVNSLKIVFGLSIPISAYFMYKLLRKYLSVILALAGAILYVYVPYRAVEIFVRGSVGEIVAFVLFPLIILSVINGNLISLAISTALLIMSHNILSYMFFPFLILLILLNRKTLRKNLTGLLLGLLLSIYFWAPAILESRLFKYDTVFNFYDHFPTLKQFITPYFGYGASVPGPYDTMSFYFGLIGILVCVLGTLTFIKNFKKFKNNEKIFFGWGLTIFLISIFMMNHRSALIWEHIPLLPYFQFPWRFLSMIVLSSPFFLIGLSKLKYKNYIGLFVVIMAISSTFSYFKYSEYLGRNDNYYLNRYVPYSSVSEEYKKTSEEYLRLPVGNSQRPDKIYPKAYTDSVAALEIKEINALDAQIKTNSDEEFILNYNKYYYPGWIAKIDGIKVEISTGKPFGQISIDVPKGEHTVLVEYKESGLRLFFDLVSLVSLGLIIYLIYKKNNEK